MMPPPSRSLVRSSRIFAAPPVTSGLVRAVLFAACAVSVARACYIQNQDSGVCTDMVAYAADPALSSQMPFCGPLLRYPSACLPRQYAYFPNTSVLTKDTWVQQFYTQAVNRRVLLEGLGDPNSANPPPQAWEASGGPVASRFSRNKDCQNAYKAYLCYMNFPRCDATAVALTLCKSVCENFFKACNYPTSMWRCGPAEYYGGDAPEPSTNLNLEGVPIYMRSQFPGQPFTANSYAPDGVTEYPVCTPGLAGGAPRGASVHALAVAGVVGAVLAALRWQR